ncbi:MAG: helix-turn-helix domain-containing protein [Roseiflexaceae bacterium]
MQRFGEKVRTLRVRRNMTQWELSHALGYAAQSYIHEIEAGKKQPTAELVVKVARLFQVTTDQLLLDELELAESAAEQ